MQKQETMKPKPRKVEGIPLFSVNEGKNRSKKVRKEMEKRGLDCLLVFTNNSWFGSSVCNVRYLTQLCHGFNCVFPLDGEPVAFGTLAHSTSVWQRSTNWPVNIVPSRGAKGIVDVLTEMGYSKAKIGVVGFGRTTGGFVPETVPYNLFSGVKELLPNTKLDDASSLMDEVREVKSEEELAFLQKSADIGTKMHEAIVETARPGVRECEIVGNMLQAELANGGEYAMIILDSGYPTLIHARGNPPVSSRRLEKGDIIITEYHSNYAGYLVGIEHSYSLGEPPAEYRKIHEVCEQVYESGNAAIRAGAKLSDVGKAFLAPVTKAKMNYIECGMHGHGLFSPEYPSMIFGGLPIYKRGTPQGMTEDLFDREMARAGSVTLKENSVFAHNIDIFDPSFNDDSCLMLGDTIVVTKNKPRKLTKIPIEFTVL